MQPSLTRLREIGQIYGIIECVRCSRADEIQKYWLFSCCFLQNILYTLFNSYIVDITQVIDNKVEDCFLYEILEYEKEVPASRELFEKDFITIRYLWKEATYGKKCTREEELELFKNNIREGLYFIDNVVKTQKTEEAFSRICGKIITRKGIINIPQGVVTTWKLSL